jgi:deoxyribonuclease I
MNIKLTVFFKSAIFFLMIFLLFSGSVHGQKKQSFSQAKKHLVEIYKANPEVKSFYCGCDILWTGKKGTPISESCGYEPRRTKYRSGKENPRIKRIEWEHVVPAYWFGHQLQCWKDGGRKACKKIAKFKQMEGDLHNLQPVIGELNDDRSYYRFSMLKGEPRKYGQCDFEVIPNQKKVEPSPNIRGDIARTYFYMSNTYGMKLSKQQTQLFNTWDKTDPVDDWEKMRNMLIQSAQGNGNLFVK